MTMETGDEGVDLVWAKKCLFIFYLPFWLCSLPWSPAAPGGV